MCGFSERHENDIQIKVGGGFFLLVVWIFFCLVRGVSFFFKELKVTGENGILLDTVMFYKYVEFYWRKKLKH